MRGDGRGGMGEKIEMVTSLDIIGMKLMIFLKSKMIISKIKKKQISNSVDWFLALPRPTNIKKNVYKYSGLE